MSKYKCGVQVLIDPADISVGRNARFAGHTEEAVEEMALSFEKNGQRQAIEVRYVGEELRVVFGHRRHAAALLHNERNPGNKMKLKCVVTSCNDLEALERGIVENKDRTERPSPMDDAINQRSLREDHGKSNREIAEFYRCSEGKVSLLSKLPGLPVAVQRKIHAGEIGLKAAVDLAGMNEEEQKEVLAEPDPKAMVDEEFDAGTNGEIAPTLYAGDAGDVKTKAQRPETVTQRVAKKAREKAIDKGKSKTRTLLEVKKFFESIAHTPEGEDEASVQAKEFAKLMLKFIGGSIREKTMFDKIEAML